MTTYRISTWDPGDTPADDWSWVPRLVGLSLQGVRPGLRMLRELGYADKHCVLVEREDNGRAAP